MSVEVFGSGLGEPSYVKRVTESFISRRVFVSVFFVSSGLL